MTTALATKPPSYLKNVENTSVDNFDSDDIIIPRIKLLQGLSPEVQDHPDANIGDFWHTGLDVSVGDTFEFVICNRRKKYLLMAPMSDGQGILARADDAVTWDKLGKWDVQIDKRAKAVWTINDLDVVKSGLTEWGSSFPEDPDSPPAATLIYEYLVLLRGNEELGPCIMSLARSQIAPAKKQLNTKVSLHKSKNRPLQCVVYRAGSTSQVNPSGQEFLNYTFGGAGFADEKLYNSAMEIYENIPMDQIRVEEEESVGQEETAKVEETGEY